MAQHPVTNPPTGAAAGGGRIRAALKCAFPYTIPIFAGFWFLGMTYGIYMNVSGFSFWYPLLMSLTIFGGSLEFVAVSMLLAPYAPVQCFLMALMIQARHLFYGIAMLVIYCLRNVSLLSGSHGLPELIGIAVTVGLHLWKRQMLLSIAGGTICYMLLVQLVF